jgi:hypothetical protein
MTDKCIVLRACATLHRRQIATRVEDQKNRRDRESLRAYLSQVSETREVASYTPGGDTSDTCRRLNRPITCRQVRAKTCIESRYKQSVPSLFRLVVTILAMPSSSAYAPGCSNSNLCLPKQVFMLTLRGTAVRTAQVSCFRDVQRRCQRPWKTTTRGMKARKLFKIPASSPEQGIVGPVAQRITFRHDQLSVPAAH